MVDVDENTRSGIEVKLRSTDVGASAMQMGFVERCLDLYEREGVIAGDRGQPLYRDCPDACECWRGIPEAAYPSGGEEAVSLPWIGPAYSPGGVTVVAINMNKYGGLGAQWWIRRGDNRRLREGRRPDFAYGTGAYLALAHRSLSGSSRAPEVTPDEAAEAWEASAFLEAVKCSPEQGVSTPTDAMWRNCPPRFLREELDILKPGVLILLGRDTWTVGKNATRAIVNASTRGLERGEALLGDRTTKILCLYHPSRAVWRNRSIRALIDSLRERPLSGTVSRGSDGRARRQDV